MILRPYQDEALTSLRNSLIAGVKKPLVCLPTGAGKSVVIASFIHQVQQLGHEQKIVVAVHTQELVSQLSETYRKVSGLAPAVYSASLGVKKIGPVTFAQIQSISKKACDFGAIKLLVIDEADRCPDKGVGQYRTFIKQAKIVNPDMRIAGFTATPYRLGSGLVYGPEQPFDEMVYDISVKQLIEDGYLSKLTSKNGGAPDLKGVHVRQGDFVASELEAVMSDEETVKHACDEILRYGANRKSWLLFTSGLKHAALVHEELKTRGVVAPIIEGDMDKPERKKLIDAHRAHEVQALINVNVLTVGYDAPGVDMIVLLRPTKSAGLYYQMIGRGLRKAPEKQDCLILDLAGNITHHGPIDTLNERIKEKKKKGDEPGVAPTKTCAQCQEIVPAGVRTCPACGAEFPPLPVAKHDTVAAYESPLSTSEIIELPIESMGVRVHTPKDPAKAPSLCVTYKQGRTSVSEWVSLDPKSHFYAYQMGRKWLRSTPFIPFFGRTLAMDGDALIGHDGEKMVRLDTAIACVPFLGCIPKPRSIRYQTAQGGSKYPKVISRSFSSDPNTTG
jgi:DNA repair protein RadD